MQTKVPLTDAMLQPVYCVSHAERDANIRSSMARITQRIQPGPPRTEPLAIVAYGPSLNQTWEQIKAFRFIITMSGAHKFLLDRSLTPTWHVDVEPRPHKYLMLGKPSHDVKYLLAADCHPNYFDYLKDYDVTLWQILSQEEGLQGMWDEGDYAIGGGSSVGARALTIGRFLGFQDFHIFGMDGCFGASGSHADSHTNAPPPEARIEVEANGQTYSSTASMLLAVKEMGDQMDNLPNCSFTYYGKGLVQDCAAQYTPRVWRGDVAPVLAIQKINPKDIPANAVRGAQVKFQKLSDPILTAVPA